MNSIYFRLLLLLFFATLTLGRAASQCTTDAGTMQADAIVTCDEFPVVPSHQGDEVLDGDDVLNYMMHTDPGNSPGTVIVLSEAPIFLFVPGSMTYGVTYYISAVAGNDDGSGNVDLTDPCLSVAPGTPVTFTEPISIECLAENVLCDGQFTPDCTVTGGTPPYQYQWTPAVGVSNPTVLNPILTSGITYQLLITDSNGCTVSFPLAISSPPPLALTISGTPELSCENGSAPLTVAVTGGTSPYTFQWSTGATTQDIIVSNPGVYTVIVTDALDCEAAATFVVTLSTADCGIIQGTVVHDENENCAEDASEPGLGGWLVRATGSEVFHGFTENDGSYVIPVLPGDYNVELIPPANGYWENCQGAVSATIASNTDSDTVDFQAKVLTECPGLEVDISTPLLRRCFPNNFTVSYCNYGTVPAFDAYVEVTLDPLFLVTATSLPYTGPVGDIYTFEIGDVAVGECGSFTIETGLSCDAVLGQTLCTEAHIFPDSLCLPDDPTWSGAEIQVTYECTADSVIFTIENIGIGDMTEPSEFIVVEDGVMLMTTLEEFTLTAGGTLSLSFPANGSTYVIMVSQVAGFPGLSNPVIAVEGCGTNNLGLFSTGFVTQFPENDADPFISIDCQPVIGSFDPNDKNGYPTGYGDEHLIEPGQELDYHIRFQNTGTDTAFTVVIHDVIAGELDLSTLRPGTSSHPYELEIHGDTLVFIFENILLPDSNVNEPGSHGFVKFRIGQTPGLPLGTVIENEAAIYFDFNDPIVTNTTVHKLGEHFIISEAREPVLPRVNWALFPNPFSDEATLVIEGADFQTFNLRLYDLTGRFIKIQKVTGGFTKIKKEGLSAGLYFYEIELNGLTVGQGKLAVQD